MIKDVVGWWKRQPIIVKILSGAFVAIIVVLALVGGAFVRGRPKESSVVDAAVSEYDRHAARREGELLKMKAQGRAKEKAADKRIQELDEQGAQATEEREERDDEIGNADSWSDLDSELGKPRNRRRCTRT
jgi:hypothetical protein